jgi:hypothetical protein
VLWPLNFKPSGIEKYDGSTNPAEWLVVYQLTTEVTGGDSYVIANNLQSTCHHLPGHGPSGFPRGLFVPGTTYAGYSPVTSVPDVHIRELTGT